MLPHVRDIVEIAKMIAAELLQVYSADDIKCIICVVDIIDHTVSVLAQSLASDEVGALYGGRVIGLVGASLLRTGTMPNLENL